MSAVTGAVAGQAPRPDHPHDDGGTLTLTDARMTEGVRAPRRRYSSRISEFSAVPIQFTVRHRRPVRRACSDYVAQSGTPVTIPAGSRRRCRGARGDRTVVEPNETFLLVVRQRDRPASSTRGHRPHRQRRWSVLRVDDAQISEGDGGRSSTCGAPDQTGRGADVFHCPRPWVARRWQGNDYDAGPARAPSQTGQTEVTVPIETGATRITSRRVFYSWSAAPAAPPPCWTNEPSDGQGRRRRKYWR